MIHTNLIEQILDLADAPLLHQQIGIKLNEEKLRREKFYNDIDESMKVEFINGEIIVHSPVMKRHNEANGLLYKILDTYVRKKDLGFVGFEKIMVVFTRNDYEPDLVFFDKVESDEMKPTQTLFPVPDFVVEVLSNGTKKYDRGIKYDDYETHKVKEYWIIDPDNEVVEQYILKDDVYELVYKSSQGMIKSVVVKDFEIPIRAIFDADINFEVLQKMMQS
jgi:Uma2 family endonuclease